MEAITRNVSDIPASDLPAFEHLIGAPLRPSQTIVVQVIERESNGNDLPRDTGDGKLPEWINVYEGLTDEEIDRLEEGFQRLDLTRREL